MNSLHQFRVQTVSLVRAADPKMWETPRVEVFRVEVVFLVSLDSEPARSIESSDLVCTIELARHTSIETGRTW
jgi:hypothetical protein